MTIHEDTLIATSIYKDLIEGKLTTFFNNEKYFKPIYDEVACSGKRLRPMTTLMVSNVIGGDQSRALSLGIATEFTHAASLVIDDVLDDDDVRRGKPSAHQMFGIAQAFLCGVSLPMLALNTAYTVGGADATHAISKCFHSMCEGAIIELLNPLDAPATKLYKQIIDMKTAQLFSLAADFGAISKEDVSPDVRRAIQKWGLYLGRAYQQADDLVDLVKLENGQKDFDIQTGSELMLLKAVKVDSMGKELVKDFLNGSIDPLKGLGHFNELFSFDIKPQIVDMIIDNLRRGRSALAMDDIPDKLLGNYALYCIEAMLKEGGVDVAEVDRRANGDE